MEPSLPELQSEVLLMPCNTRTRPMFFMTIQEAPSYPPTVVSNLIHVYLDLDVLASILRTLYKCCTPHLFLEETALQNGRKPGVLATEICTLFLVPFYGKKKIKKKVKI